MNATDMSENIGVASKVDLSIAHSGGQGLSRGSVIAQNFEKHCHPEEGAFCPTKDLCTLLEVPHS